MIMMTERGLKKADWVAPTAETVVTMKMLASTLHTACNRMVMSVEKPETYENGGAQRNGTIQRRSSSARYHGAAEARGKQ